MAKQTQQELRFICVYCGKETTVIVNISQSLATKRKSVTKAYDCEHCNKANKIEVRDNVDVQGFILGRDRGFLHYASDGIPVLQGEKDV